MITATYRIRIDGELDDWSASSLDDLDIDRRTDRTVLLTPSIDQAGLIGVLDRLQSIGAVIIELHRVDLPHSG